MNYEFDPRKSESNKSKHGIDFTEAQALWDDPDLIEIPVKTSDEPRFGTGPGKDRPRCRRADSRQGGRGRGRSGIRRG